MRRWTGRMAWSAGVVLTALLASASGWSQNGTQEPASRSIEMVPAKAELQKGLNAKKLKPGEPVTAKLEQTVNLPDVPALKQNTVLEGHVDAVQASQHHSNSKITVTFNQAKLKDGTVLPVKVTVMQVAAPENPAMTQAQAETGAPMASGGMPESAPSPGAGGTGSGPGMPGTAQPQPMPQPMNTQPSTQGAAAANQQNGVPGVMLQSDIHQSASATFLAKGRNVEVPSGTQMQLAIAYIPKGVQLH